MNSESIGHACSHPGCRCESAPGSEYCGPHCESLGTTAEVMCGCKHPACDVGLTAVHAAENDD